MEVQGASGARVQNIGGFHVRIDDEREWLEFKLGATVDPIEVDGYL